MKLCRLTLAFLVLSLGCCAAMVVVGAAQYQTWTARQMLVLYSFAWAGFAMGLFPARKTLSAYGEEWRRGVTRDRYPISVRHQAVFYASVICMVLLAFVLGT
jgi:hypothetical protein